MKKILKWVFTHEPLLIAGVVLGVALFLGLRYGATASATAQASWPTELFFAFGLLRNFVSSPATRAALDAAPGQVAPMADDVGYLSQFVGELIHHPGGLPGLLFSHEEQFVHALKDLEQRVMGEVHGKPIQPSDPPATTTTVAPLTIHEPAPAEPDAVAALAKLV